jgi:hypothetical protein
MKDTAVARELLLELKRTSWLPPYDVRRAAARRSPPSHFADRAPARPHRRARRTLRHARAPATGAPAARPLAPSARRWRRSSFAGGCCAAGD